MVLKNPFPCRFPIGTKYNGTISDLYSDRSCIKSTAALGLGSTNVKYVDIHRVSAYLSKYFSEKDHEWFLPEGVHHYTTSRDIHLNDFVPDPDWIYVVMPLRFVRDVNGILIRNYIGEIECVYNNVEWYTKYPPPFEFLLSRFYEKLNINH